MSKDGLGGLEFCLHSVLCGSSTVRHDVESCYRCGSFVDSRIYRSGLHYREGGVWRHYFAKAPEDLFYLRKMRGDKK